jgi:hypothetical protein
MSKINRRLGIPNVEQEEVARAKCALSLEIWQRLWFTAPETFALQGPAIGDVFHLATEMIECFDHGSRRCR